jgi:beta-glucosidase
MRRDYGAVPVYITENGASFDDPPPSAGLVEDPQRAAYLRGHLDALGRAVADGVDVRRYCVWSLLDNFEWEHGYDKRFGIVHVDYRTQQRVPKRSGLWYRDFIAAMQRLRDDRSTVLARGRAREQWPPSPPADGGQPPATSSSRLPHGSSA